MRLIVASVVIALSPLITTAVPQAPDSCPVTKPSEPPFQPPAPYPSAGSLWVGSPRLWTNVPADGVWNGLGHYTPEDSRFRQKLFWWSEGYDLRTESQPELTVTGVRLDGPATPITTDEHANNGWTNDPDHPFMGVGIFIPTLGCWKITGQYKGEELSYVVWVSEECTANELLALLKPSDPAYADAKELSQALQSHGFIVRCVLQSKMVRTFEGQSGAAVFKTDHGDFEALFLPSGQSFDSLESIERRENGRFLYSFQGYPRPVSPHPIDSKYPMFFEKHGKQFFITWQPEVAEQIVKALRNGGGMEKVPS